jgi:hypothetical protein
MTKNPALDAGFLYKFKGDLLQLISFFNLDLYKLEGRSVPIVVIRLKGSNKNAALAD